MHHSPLWCVHVVFARIGLYVAMIGQSNVITSRKLSNDVCITGSDLQIDEIDGAVKCAKQVSRCLA